MTSAAVCQQSAQQVRRGAAPGKKVFQVSVSYSQSAGAEGHALLSEQGVAGHLMAWNPGSFEKAAQELCPV